MKHHEKKSGNKSKIASNPWVELRLVAFGSDSAGSLDCKNKSDPLLLRMYQGIGFMTASNVTTSEMFVFKYQPPQEGQSVRDSIFTLFHCVGSIERIVENGTLSYMEQSGQRSEYIVFNAHGKRSSNWVFVCDRNPRLDCHLGWVSVEYPHGFIQRGSTCIGRAAAAGDHLGDSVTLMAADAAAKKKPDTMLNRIAGAVEKLKVSSPPKAKIVPAPEAVIVPPVITPVLKPKVEPEKVKIVVPPPTPPAAVQAPIVPKKRGRKPRSKVELPSLVSKNRQMNGVEMRVPISEIIPFQPSHENPEFTGQPRVNFDPVELRELAASIAENGQTTPIQAIRVTNVPGKKYQLTDGERRWRAIQMVEGLDTARILLETYETKKDQHLASLIHNFNHVGHTPLEFSNALQLQINAGETIQRLAVLLGMKEHTIRKFLALQRLHPDLRPLLDPPTPKKDRIRINEGVELGRLAQDRQIEIWGKAKAESSRRLVMMKIKQEGAEFVVNKRTRSDSVARPRKIQHKLTMMHALVIEFSELKVADWRRYLELRGFAADVGGTIPESKQFADFVLHMEVIRQRITSAVFEARKSLNSAAAKPLELDASPLPEEKK